MGANKGSVTAFLISTPESGVDSIAVTYALLDPLMTIIRPVAAFITGVAAGLIENFFNCISFRGGLLNLDNTHNDNLCCDIQDSEQEKQYPLNGLLVKIKEGFKFAFLDIWGEIAIWFFAGLLIAGIITVLLPEDIMSVYLGGGISSMLLMLLLGIPLYICATASTPIAAALILKGVSPGAALVFLLVGPATNITSLSVLIGMLGKKGVVRYLAVLSLSSLCFGLIVDRIYFMSGISAKAVISNAAEVIPKEISVASVIVLLIFSIQPVCSWIACKFSRKTKREFKSDFPELPN